MRSLLNSKTKIVSVPHVSNVLGTIFTIKEISDLAHQFDALCFIDGCQGAIHIPVNVNEIGCDFYTFSAHKLYGPSGVGILWGKEEILKEMSPFIGGGDTNYIKNTSSYSFFLKRPLFTKMQIKLEPIALSRSTEATDESTPPDNPRITFSERISFCKFLIVISTKESGVQSCFKPEILTKKFSKIFLPFILTLKENKSIDYLVFAQKNRAKNKEALIHDLLTK